MSGTTGGSGKKKKTVRNNKIGKDKEMHKKKRGRCKKGNRRKPLKSEKWSKENETEKAKKENSRRKGKE